MIIFPIKLLINPGYVQKIRRNIVEIKHKLTTNLTKTLRYKMPTSFGNYN
jgi:hypothetical protein